MHNENEGLVTDLEQWKIEYRKDKTKVWVVLTLSDDSKYFFKNDTKEDFQDWHKIVKIARKGSLHAKEVGLRYRSNIRILPINGDGLYLSRSALGSPGVETVKTMTIGTVIGKTVFKTIVQLPALTIMDTVEDGLEDCFEEATWIWQE